MKSDQEHKLEGTFSYTTQRALLGGLAAAIGKTTTAPLERVRIIRQASIQGHMDSKSLLQSLYRDEGILGLWRGNLVNLSRVVPSYAVRLSVFGSLPKFQDTVPILGNTFVAGSIAGLASALASYPLEVVRTRMSLQGSLMDAIRQGRLMAGCFLTLLDTVPYAGLTLGTYAYIENHRLLDQYVSPLGHKMVAGILSGSVGTLVCFPIDTLRRNKIVRPNESMRSLASSLWQVGGLARYYRGIWIAVLKAAPTVAITMTVNDYLVEYWT